VTSVTGAAQDTTRPVADQQTFRDAMALLAAPVTVVTALDAAGRRYAFTAGSVTSISLDPPLVMVGIALTSSCHTAMAAAGEFCVNILGEDHRDVAQRCATHGADRFAGGEFAAWDGSGVPYLPDATVLLRCRTTERVRAGDHDLVLGTPVEIRTGDPATPPLLWYRRGFHTSAPSAAALV